MEFDVNISFSAFSTTTWVTLNSFGPDVSNVISKLKYGITEAGMILYTYHGSAYMKWGKVNATGAPSWHLLMTTAPSLNPYWDCS